MKAIKPLTQSLLYKTYEANHTFYLCTLVLSHFSFSAPSLETEPELWKFVASELGKDAMLDMCMPKPVGEVLVVGSCFPPDGLTRACEVEVKIGQIDKKLHVYGDRSWRMAGGQVLGISEPQPFASMPIGYDRSYGGPGYPCNPIGKGATPVEDQTGRQIYPLPNIEDPRHPLLSPHSAPPLPAGFGPIDQTWPQRLNKAGTYDQHWYESLFPGLAADIDLSFFNAAPPDQWLKGYFTGDEPFELKALHPQKPLLKGRLPGVRSRCFACFQDGEFREIGLSLDTVWLFPHSEKGISIWRGVTEIATDDGEDVQQLLVAYERLDAPLRSQVHYREALNKRLDEDKGFLYMLDEKDLIPPGELSGLAALLADTDNEAGPMAQNMERKAEKERQRALERKQKALEKARAAMQKAGVDEELIEKRMAELANPAPGTPLIAPPQMPEIDPTNFDPEAMVKAMAEMKAFAAEAKKKAETLAAAQKEKALDTIRAMCAKRGLDAEAMIARFEAEQQARQPKRPVFSADDTLVRLKANRDKIDRQIRAACAKLGTDFATVLADVRQKQAAGKSFPLIEMVEKAQQLNPDDPDLIARLRQAEDQSKKMYRMSAHHQPQFPPLPDAEAEQLRTHFLALLDQGESLVGRDFSGIDLRGLNLQGVDLSECYLEGANLCGVDLCGGNLTKAVLAFADLSNADLSGARLSEANLGAADLSGTRLAGADLSDAQLGKAQLRETDLTTARLDQTDFMETRFESTNFSRASLTKAVLIDADLSGCTLVGTDLTESILIKPNLDGADLSDSCLVGVNFLQASARQTRFCRADLTNARFPQSLTMAGCDFSDACLEEANLMEANLSASTLTNARLNRANLMNITCHGGDLRGVAGRQLNLMKADIQDTLLSGADLMEANLKNARLVNVDLSNASLYSAELMRLETKNCLFQGTNLRMTKRDTEEAA